MTSYELRVLSGLHRGAVLPLDEETLSIGAHEEADIVLVDPGVQKLHAQLSRSESGWFVASSGGDVFSAGGALLQEASALACGCFVRIGPVWICISDEGDPWPEPPAVAEPAPAAAPAAQDAGDVVAEPPQPPRRKGRRAVFIPALVLVATTAAAAYAFTSKPAQQTDASEQTAVIAPDAGAARPTPRKMTQADLQKEFRKRLANAELIDRFDLQLEDDAWDMRGNLDDEESARFGRVLAAFTKEYGIGFPVHARIVPEEGMLSFKISQVMSGANAGIVTADGHRMYVGDEINGIRLLAVSGNRLTFMGRRKIEIVW